MIIEVLANDKTYINIAIVDMRSQLQCVDKGDSYSRAVFYASSMMIQHSVSGKGYTALDTEFDIMSSKQPNVISIWIIRDKIKNGIIENRTSPIEEVVHCMLPTTLYVTYQVG